MTVPQMKRALALVKRAASTDPLLSGVAVAVAMALGELELLQQAALEVAMEAMSEEVSHGTAEADAASVQVRPLVH